MSDLGLGRKTEDEVGGGTAVVTVEQCNIQTNSGS